MDNERSYPMFRSKITTAAAFSALAVAVLGATPAGHAAGELVPGKQPGGAAHVRDDTTPRVWTSSAHANVAAGARCESVPVG